MGICPSCSASNADQAKFCQECGSRLLTPSHARRSLVTALFCDLVGSTELGERLDPELLRRVLDPYFEAMRVAIERHGGTVEKFMGDAVVGAFGVPTAHEDDTLRAMRAAFEMREAAAKQDAGIEDPDIRVRVRIAISCAEAFADESAARQGRISGDAFNTAARLQAAGEPGDVLVSGAAEQMLRGRVDLSPLGPVALRGKAQPVDAYRVLRISPTQIRIESPLVGRDRPLTALRSALEDAIEARACVLVTVLGPPGVGKSRLVTAFADAVRDRAEVLVGQTPSYGDGVTFAPLVELLAQAAALPSSDGKAIAAALRKRLAAEPDGGAVGDRLAHVLGVGEATASDTPWAVRRLLEVLASRRPLVVVVEDVHWAETPMLDLVDAIVERFHGPALVLCLARPELLEQRPNWAAGKPRATTSTLPPLASQDARHLAKLLLGQQAPASILDRVCETAEGNPLYLEQLSAMLADQGLLADGSWIGSHDADVEIPLTLQALLAARFDQLDPATRLLLERTSVEGRRFRISAVVALAPGVGTGEVEAALTTLERRGFVQLEDEATGRWRFAHALLREAAYRAMSKEQRVDLHARLADWILAEDTNEPDADESAARHLERAFHLREELGAHDGTAADLRDRAGELFADAGARAFAALDLIMARELLGRAAVLLPDTSPRRFDFLPNLGVALTETGRPAETEALLAKAVEQAGAGGYERDALRARVQLLSNRVFRSPTEAELESAVDEARAAAEVFESLDDSVGLAEAAVAIEYFEWMRGRVAESHRWAFQALRQARAAGCSREASQAAADIVNDAVNGPLPFDRFAAVAAQLLSFHDDPISVSSGHSLMALAALGAGDQAGFHEHEQIWRDVVTRHGLAWLGATHALLIGSVEISAGDAAAGETRLREARDVLAGLGDIWWVSTLDGYLCTAVAAQDRPREFLRLADAFDEALFVPDRQTLIRRSLIRSRAKLLRGSAADAEVAARRGLELAQSSDLILDHADALLTLAEIIDARGLQDDAKIARSEAAKLFRGKGSIAALAHLGV